jgi:hypothetical protein
MPIDDVARATAIQNKLTEAGRLVYEATQIFNYLSTRGGNIAFTQPSIADPNLSSPVGAFDPVEEACLE